MIEQIVGSIIEAESKAEEIAAAAQEKSKAIAFESQSKAEDMLESAAAQNKKLSREREAQAVKTAEEKVAQTLADGKRLADGEIDKYGKNRDKAVDLIVEKLVGKCQ